MAKTSEYYSASHVQETFRHFDKDNSGYIDESELFNAMTVFKKDITREDISVIISKLDSDHSGKVSYDEFLTLMCKKE